MAVATGSERGRAGVISWVGIIAGFAAPMLVAGFMVYGAIEASEIRGSYSSIKQPMSDLGDGTDGVATAYAVVQYVTAGLFVAIAFAVYRRIPASGDMVLGFLAIAGFTVGLALTRCTEGVDECNGDPVDITHNILAVSIAALIVLIPLGAARQIPRRGLYAPIRTASRYAWKLALLAVVIHLGVAAYTDDVRGLTERLIWVVGYGWLLFVAGVMTWQWRGRAAPPLRRRPGTGRCAPRLVEMESDGAAGSDTRGSIGVSLVAGPRPEIGARAPRSSTASPAPRRDPLGGDHSVHSTGPGAARSGLRVDGKAHRRRLRVGSPRPGRASRRCRTEQAEQVESRVATRR